MSETPEDIPTGGDLPEVENVEVEDPEDFTTIERLRQIYETRSELRQIRAKASQVRNNPNTRRHQKMQALQMYRSGVESYILEVDTLLKMFDPGPELYHNRDYGTVVIRPPGRWERRFGHYRSKNLETGPNQPLKVKSLPDAKSVKIAGLRTLFEEETPITRKFEFTPSDRRIGSSLTKTNGAVIGWNQLNRMVSDVNAFLGEVGMGLDAEEKSDVADLNYTDLI